MYLKRIDVLGFKSFSGKTKIPFEMGISCIVGPNGSGKSNIADAVRWVLGEQSAHSLRGGKFEDIIFSGSKKRKALGMAEVSITFDNSDGHFKLPYTEVTVTRRTYRTGGSEYLINNQPSRLKDVHELLWDSGISLEGISLIGQNKINDIITAQPQDRRTIVEEAAGILKYRNRKKEACRKLDQTAASLIRIEDIIGELESILGPLKEQSEKAKKFLELKAEAEQLEMAVSLHILSEAEGRLSDIVGRIKELAEDVLKAEVAQSQDEAKAESLHLLINNLDEEIVVLQKEYHEEEKERERLKSRIELTEVEKNAAQKEEERLQNELNEFASQEEKLKLDEEKVNSRIIELEEEIASREARVTEGEGDEKSRRETLAVLEDKLQKTKNEAFELANTLAECRNKLRYQEQLDANNQTALERLDGKKEEAEHYLHQLTQKENVLKENQKKVLQERTDLKAELLLMELEQKKQSEVLQGLVEKETACRYETHALSSRLSMLKEMSESNEGYYPGVKSILKAKKAGQKETEGVIDVVAKLLDVPEKYLQAIETYLSSSLQNIITVDETAAKKAVSYLKSNSLGRATFLPLDIIKAKKSPDLGKLSKIEEVYGTANQLISFPEKIRPAVDFLLSQAVIVKDLDTASIAARALDYRYSVVTLDGEMMNPGASITGGRGQKNNNDLLSKMNQVKKAEEQLKKFEIELKEHEEKLAKSREKAAGLEERAKGLVFSIKEHGEAVHQIEKELEQIEMERNLHTKQLFTMKSEKDAIKRAKEDIKIEIEEIMEVYNKEAARDAEVKDKISYLEDEYDKRRNALALDQADMTNIKVELARAQETLTAYKKSLKRISVEKENLNWSKEEKDADLILIREKLGQYLDGIEKDKLAFLELERVVKEKGDALNSKRHGLTAEMNELELLEKTIKEKSRELKDQQESLHQLELRKTRLETEWENEELKVKEKFELTFEQLKSMVSHELMERSQRDKSRTLAELRREMAALGNINLDSIAEYEDRNSRYLFLTGQKQDLIKAKESLDQVIVEMDKIMVSRFRATFKKLSEEFDCAFRRLFNGGAAALVMSDPENILDTGVEIEVQLPGKKVSNYNLLSGGEKALCGIALLFAVLIIKPTPFCLMDEVDSALDEANVDRFAAFLKDLSQETQFLMITHRQGTMEAASSLWGVTMEEEGVSKLISMKLPEEYKEKAEKDELSEQGQAV